LVVAFGFALLSMASLLWHFVCGDVVDARNKGFGGGTFTWCYQMIIHLIDEEGSKLPVVHGVIPCTRVLFSASFVRPG